MCPTPTSTNYLLAYFRNKRKKKKGAYEIKTILLATSILHIVWKTQVANLEILFKIFCIFYWYCGRQSSLLKNHNKVMLFNLMLKILISFFRLELLSILTSKHLYFAAFRQFFRSIQNSDYSAAAFIIRILGSFLYWGCF